MLAATNLGTTRQGDTVHNSHLERFERIVMEVLSQHKPSDVTKVEQLSSQPNQYSTQTFGVKARANDGSSATAYIRLREGWGQKQ